MQTVVDRKEGSGASHAEKMLQAINFGKEQERQVRRDSERQRIIKGLHLFQFDSS